MKAPNVQDGEWCFRRELLSIIKQPAQFLYVEIAGQSGLVLRRESFSRPGGGRERRVVETYDYRDESGELLFQVVRYEPKHFRCRRPDGQGDWIWHLDDTPRVLYRLPELLAADEKAWAFICEGGKDVDNVRSLGLTTTTCQGGAGKWGGLHDDSALYGRRVVDHESLSGRAGSVASCFDAAPGREPMLDASPRAFASHIKKLVRDQSVAEGILWAIPWDELEQKMNVPNRVKKIRGKLDVPRERFWETADRRYRTVQAP